MGEALTSSPLLVEDDQRWSQQDPPLQGEVARSAGGVSPSRWSDTPPSALRAATSPCGGGKETASEVGAGFTLIEIMVALVVFSLAALALIRLEGATIRSTGILEETLLAQMVARTVAVDAVTEGTPPALGRASGVAQNGGRGWRWTRDVRATGDAQILRVDVAVLDGGGRTAGRLTMIRPPTITATAR